MSSPSLAPARGRLLVAALTAVLFAGGVPLALAQSAPELPAADTAEKKVPAEENAEAAPASTDAPPAATFKLPDFTVTTDREVDAVNASDAISTSRIKTSIIDTPQAISVVTPELIKRVAPIKVFDVVAYTAGVSEGTSAGYFGNRVSFRGFPAITSAFVDGISGSNFEIPQVERIEVLKGPNAVLAPTGLPGGTMNVVTKSPQFKRAGSFTVTLGQFDAQRATLDMTGPFERDGHKSKHWAYRMVASVQDTKRFQDHSERKQLILLPSLTWKSGTTSATLKWNYYYSDPTHESRHPIFWNVGTGQDAVTYPGIARDAYFSEPVLTRFSRTNQPSLQVNSQLSANIAMRLFTVYSEDLTNHETFTDNLAVGAGGAVDPRTGRWTPGFTYDASFNPVAAAVPSLTNVARSGSGLNTNNRRTIVQNDYVAVYELPHNIKSTTIAGWSFTRTSQWTKNFFGTAGTINLLAPVLSQPITLGATPAVNSTNRGRTVNGFVMERVEALGGRLHLSAGLQWLRDRNKSTNVNTGAVLFTDVETATKLYSALWKLNDITSVYYSFNENAAPVNSGLPNTPVIFQAGTQDEVGLKWEPLGRKLRVGLAAYQISQSNFQFTNPARISDPNAPATLFTDLTSKGWEIEVSGSVNKQINIVGNYSRSKIRDPWNRPQRGAADHSAAFYGSYKWTDGSLKGLLAGLGVNYQGRRPGDSATGFTALGVPIQPSFNLGAYTVVKANLDYTWGKYDFQLSVDNLLDETYIQSALTRNGVFMGSGRNIQFTTTVRF